MGLDQPCVIQTRVASPFLMPEHVVPRFAVIFHFVSRYRVQVCIFLVSQGICAVNTGIVVARVWQVHLRSAFFHLLVRPIELVPNFCRDSFR
jgi:hypothetical protein